MKPWYQTLYCERCNQDTRQRGVRVGLWELYTCLTCQARRMYKVG